MARMLVKSLLFSLCIDSSVAAPKPKKAKAHDKSCDVAYTGIVQNEVENFFGIPYGQDTGGANRFKPPQPYIPTKGASIDATSRGPVCPQPKEAVGFPLYVSSYDRVSEDCLHLNIYRPIGTKKKDKLPVLLFIHGGSFYEGSKDELVSQPAGLVQQSADNGDPIIVVEINYRLGVFGFAQSDALQAEGSTNAGLRDQRLGIEWAKAHIAAFGGDPKSITISGQSSGGLAVGLQIMAYGATKPLPFHRAICESQALEPGITGNFTRNAMGNLAAITPCDATDLQSAETIACLRDLSMQDLLDAQITSHSQDPGQNLGDEWLPVVDGDFLPAAPSDLITQGAFHSVPAIIGWTDTDTLPFVGSLPTAADVRDLYRGYLPAFTEENLDTLLSLYPEDEFAADPVNNISASTFRGGRILRDIVMTCQPIYYAQAIAYAGSDVYLYDWNQTMLEPFLPGYGPVHTSEFAYVFGNLSHYDIDGYPFNPTASDAALRDRGAGSWASFVSQGMPSNDAYTTLKGWTPAFAKEGEVDIFVAGGPSEGLSPEDGPSASPALAAQRLRERCAFINSPEIIKQLQY